MSEQARQRGESRVFTSRPEHYHRNIFEGRRTYAYSAVLTGPDNQEPGVVIFTPGTHHHRAPGCGMFLSGQQRLTGYQFTINPT
ncbi:hypothetical protein IWX75_002912 [Arthrobacter sp. CAN_A6]|uniref:hypothetical protein n=1 Tax=Arthrobacter sp. CAN_A6 TaxID=2787721 RepID=UPI0018CA05D0